MEVTTVIIMVPLLGVLISFTYAIFLLVTGNIIICLSLALVPNYSKFCAVCREHNIVTEGGLKFDWVIKI